MDRKKELKRLIYLRSELIKQCKKEIKQYHQELDTLQGYNNLERSKQKVKRRGK